VRFISSFFFFSFIFARFPLVSSISESRFQLDLITPAKVFITTVSLKVKNRRFDTPPTKQTMLSGLAHIIYCLSQIIALRPTMY
jgi:hypothetical protein